MGGAGDDAGLRGRRSRAASPSPAMPNGVLTPTGSQNVANNVQNARVNDDLLKDGVLKGAEARDGEARGAAETPPLRSGASVYHHLAPPIDPDLRAKNLADLDRSPGGSGSHYSSHHLLPPSTPRHHATDSDSDAESDSGMRIGDDYQAVIPDYDPEATPESNHGAMLIWAPKAEVDEQKLDDYITMAKEKYGYNTEQALGMLFWHKYNVDRAISDLANFTPFPDDWSIEDKVLFEQAFSFHGKSFHRIRQMLPDKSIASLVKYYYSWKKTRYRTSVMDRQARRLQASANEDAAIGFHDNVNGDTNDLPEEMDSGDSGDGASPASAPTTHCSNCALATSHLCSTSKGSQLCSTCYSYWRRTGLMRSALVPSRRPTHGNRDDSGVFNKGAVKPKPPKDMNLAQDDLDLFTLGPAPGPSTTTTSISSNPSETHKLLNPNASQ